MADENGERSRRKMDLNLHLGFPPLAQPRSRDLSADLALWSLPLRSLGPEENHNLVRMPDLSEPQFHHAPSYSPSDPLFSPDPFPIDPMCQLYLCNWPEGLSPDAIEPVTVPLDITDPSPSSPFVGTSSDADDLLLNLEAAEESPSREDNVGAPYSPSFMRALRIRQRDDEVASALPMLLVPVRDITVSGNDSSPRQHPQEYPQLRFQRLIEVNQLWGIRRLESEDYDSRAHSATSPERLMHDILHSQSSLLASRKRKLNADGKQAVDLDVDDKNCECAVNFECNICFEMAREPVVTPCGHLFCWPCLYQWLHAHSEHSECPVCKGEVLEVNVTPIYGRGGGTETLNEGDHGESGASAIKIPPRPHARRVESSRLQLHRAVSIRTEELVRRFLDEARSGVQIEAPGTARRSLRFDTRRRIREHRAWRRWPDLDAMFRGPGTAGNQPVARPPRSSSSADGASISSTMAVIAGDVAPMDGINNNNRDGSSTSARTRGRSTSSLIDLAGGEIQARRRRVN